MNLVPRHKVCYSWTKKGSDKLLSKLVLFALLILCTVSSISLLAGLYCEEEENKDNRDVVVNLDVKKID